MIVTDNHSVHHARAVTAWITKVNTAQASRSATTARICSLLQVLTTISSNRRRRRALAKGERSNHCVR
ncbi:hypothetical protein [Catellatospora bangladeshensis]|uniref:hypothetical protein n=2 Tax=Catellatospora bangladeshensis TaxID=310355 RepID=UPI00194356AA|nr:hypothetical protein [Catellatospora bangladeshensis]